MKKLILLILLFLCLPCFSMELIKDGFYYNYIYKGKKVLNYPVEYAEEYKDNKAYIIPIYDYNNDDFDYHPGYFYK